MIAIGPVVCLLLLLLRLLLLLLLRLLPLPLSVHRGPVGGGRGGHREQLARQRTLQLDPLAADRNDASRVGGFGPLLLLSLRS